MRDTTINIKLNAEQLRTIIRAMEVAHRHSATVRYMERKHGITNTMTNSLERLQEASF
jgi:hypothetical protein